MRVLHGSSAHRAGVSAGDTLIALNRIKVDNSNLETLLGRYQAGDQVDVTAFRRDELMQFKVTLEAGSDDTAYLQIEDEGKLAGWLN